MKKRMLSLFVLIGCMSVLCLRFRKRAHLREKYTLDHDTVPDGFTATMDGMMEEEKVRNASSSAVIP